MSDTRDADHLWHVWINKRQQERNDQEKCRVQVNARISHLRSETDSECFRAWCAAGSSSVYDLMAKTCAWHIYTEATGTPEGHHFSIDTSMGYLLDETDRIFWDRVHSNMASSFADEEDDADKTPKESQ